MSCPHRARGPAISVVVVWMPGAARPAVIPAEGDFRPCLSCNQLFAEVDRAVTGRGIHAWTRAVVLDVTGNGFELQCAQPEARA